MAKLVVLTLAFVALVAFASAHKTIVTTTIEEDDIDNPRGRGSQQQCRQKLEGQRFNQCQRYLTQQGESPYGDNPRRQQQQGLQQCCQELQNVDEQCQCEAVKQVFRQAQQQQQREGQQGGRYGSQQMGQLKQMAQSLPRQCNLETRQCEVRTIVTTTTIDEDDLARRGSQQCRQRIQGQRFNQCQRYMSQQSGYETLVMPIFRPRQQQQGLQQCCEELRNVEEQCQCEAVQEVFRQAQQQQQQGRQQRGRRGEQEQQIRELKEKAQDLPRQCNLEVQQCRIPAAIF